MLTPSPLPRTLPAAIRDSVHKKLEVRLSAVRDLGRLAIDGERARALETLVDVLARDSSPGVRSEAAVALADAGAHEHVAALVAAMEDESARVRQMAMVALGEVATSEDEDACRVIERELDAGEPEARFQALVAWHHVAPDRCAPRALAALEDPDSLVRYVALRIVEERSAEDPSVRERVREALADPASDVRLAAAILLARAGDAAGRSAIVQAVETGLGTRELEDAAAAIELAGELGFSEATQGLERRAFGLLGVSRDPFAWQARVALARLGHQRAKNTILRGLSAWSRDARTLAVAAAGAARLAEAKPLLEGMRGDPRRADPDAIEEALARIEQGRVESPSR